MGTHKSKGKEYSWVVKNFKMCTHKSVDALKRTLKIAYPSKSVYVRYPIPSSNVVSSSPLWVPFFLPTVVNRGTPLAMFFPTMDSAVLDNPFQVTPKREYMLLGKGVRGYKKRALFMFHVQRIQRHHIIHSAKLQMYYVGERQERSSLNILARNNRAPIVIEVYVVKSSRWKSSNVTSRMPWHGDHLDLSKDVDSKMWVCFIFIFEALECKIFSCESFSNSLSHCRKRISVCVNLGISRHLAFCVTLQNL